MRFHAAFAEESMGLLTDAVFLGVPRQMNTYSHARAYCLLTRAAGKEEGAMSRSSETTPLKQKARLHKKRRDAGRKKLTERDWRGLHFVAEQTFVTTGQIAQWLAPGCEPAVDIPPDERQRYRHGGDRSTIGWPIDRQRRLHAVAQLVTRWEYDHGLVEMYQPLTGWAYWVRVTALALRQLGLPWSETFFPEEKEYLAPGCHTEHITHIRLQLACGKLPAPKHLWIPERALLAEQGETIAGTKRPHRPDAYLELLEDGSYDLTRGGKVVATVSMRASQRIAIELERTRKDDPRLEYILPDLLKHFHFVWYFCTSKKVYDAVVKARRDTFSTGEERQRIRILLLEE